MARFPSSVTRGLELDGNGVFNPEPASPLNDRFWATKKGQGTGLSDSDSSKGVLDTRPLESRPVTRRIHCEETESDRETIETRVKHSGGTFFV